MSIKNLSVFGLGPFRARPEDVKNADPKSSKGVELEFDERVNLLIGPNNVGKSTILQTLAIVCGGYDVNLSLPEHFRDATADDLSFKPGAIPFSYLPPFYMEVSNIVGDVRRLSGPVSYFSRSPWTEGIESDVEIQFGENAPLGGLEIDSPEFRIFYDELGYVGYYNPEMRTEDNIVGEGYLVPSVAEMGALRGFEQNLVTEISGIISEITDEFPVEAFTGKFEPGDIPNPGFRYGKDKVGTVDGDVTFPELSHGTRSILSWVSHLIFGLAKHYEGSDIWRNWKNGPGIFIIDEIDAHLHPSWQRRIIPTLQHHFPNVQIFASTHSPMMVAGLKAGQVHLLKRDETTGAVVWSRNEQDIIGWTADEIYRTFMGIDDPTDERTARHAEELRELRNKDSLATEDEVRMQELRRLVNEDLLARGALNAQDERFDEMMRRFMANRMSELSQDGV